MPPHPVALLVYGVSLFGDAVAMRTEVLRLSAYVVAMRTDAVRMRT